ncbi:MAG: phosphatase PAP2 family protein [Candidatus Eremiobacteraeota bacterium]|nr:phosphatase PAP2 family protein [Candidatus Eremiobacteraeota bacterium]MBC5804048.1 phosphatase PAP2 family protein [Candidatus Eremiobacteraeota bacterium]
MESGSTNGALRATVLVAAAICVVVAVWLSDEIAQHETFAFDTTVLETIHHATTPLLLAVAWGFTDLGPPVGLTVVTALGAVVMWRAGLRAGAVIFVLGAIFAGVLDLGLKEIFERVRPGLWPRRHVAGDSFPSGHALQGTAVYGTLTVLLARAYPHRRTLIGVVGTCLVFAIVASRAVLGVHWPTDLIAGMAIGFLCLLSIVAVIERFETHGLFASVRSSRSHTGMRS